MQCLTQTQERLGKYNVTVTEMQLLFQNTLTTKQPWGGGDLFSPQTQAQSVTVGTRHNDKCLASVSWEPRHHLRDWKHIHVIFATPLVVK